MLRAGIFQTELRGVVVVGENFCVAPPIGDHRQHPLGFILRQAVIQFAQKTAFRGAAAHTLVENAADVGGAEQRARPRAGRWEARVEFCLR